MPFPYDQVDDATMLDDAKGSEPPPAPCPGCKGTGDDGLDSPRGCPECDGTGKFENSIHDPKRGWCHMCRVTNMTICHHRKR